MLNHKVDPNATEYKYIPIREARQYRKWTKADEVKLVDMKDSRMSWKSIAKTLNRSEQSVQVRYGMLLKIKNMEVSK